MQLITLIVAAGWIEWAGPIIVFILYTIGQLVMGQGKKPPQKRVPPKPRPAADPQQQPRTLEEKLRNEVEDFLRQVKGQQPQQPDVLQKPAIPISRPVSARTERPTESPLNVEPKRISVQEHVVRSISTADVTQHAATLGAELGQTDERFQAQVQERFQHQIGALEPRQQRTVEPRRSRNRAAAEIANLLKSPNGVRQIIVASEILRRPEI